MTSEKRKEKKKNTRCTSKGRLVTGLKASTTRGPIVMFGTKRPSITSTWIQSQPANSTAFTYIKWESISNTKRRKIWKGREANYIIMSMPKKLSRTRMTNKIMKWYRYSLNRLKPLQFSIFQHDSSKITEVTNSKS